MVPIGLSGLDQASQFEGELGGYRDFANFKMACENIYIYTKLTKFHLNLADLIKSANLANLIHFIQNIQSFIRI